MDELVMIWVGCWFGVGIWSALEVSNGQVNIVDVVVAGGVD